MEWKAMTGTSNDSNGKESKKSKLEAARQAIRAKRAAQSDGAERAAQQLHSRLGEIKQSAIRLSNLTNHTKGFYEEINKLAKGKTLLPVTNLMSERANEIIRDAKDIVKNDIYLDRIKQFVPAGDNPEYPDVLVSLRSILDCLGRFKLVQEAEISSIQSKISKANTVVGAIAYFLDDEEDGDEEDKNYPSKDDVRRYVDGLVNETCFSKYRDSNDKYFDFASLDSQTIEEYLGLEVQAETESESSSLVTDGNASIEEGEDDNDE
jgi:hypothetical protein